MYASFPKYLVVLFFTCASVVTASIAWPKISQKPRPQLLEEVYKRVENTQIGKRIANALGVRNSIQEPISITSIAGEVAGSAVSIIEERAQKVITQQAIEQIVSQLNKLPEEQKEQIQEMICKPK